MSKQYPQGIERPVMPDAPPPHCTCGNSSFERSVFKAEDIYRCTHCGQDWQNRSEQ